MLLFRTSAAATQHLAADARFVGGQLGMVGVLHTWGRNLSYHPHVHYVVPGVGWAPEGQVCLAQRKHFLLPVKALSRIFRAKFRDALRDTACWEEIPATVWQQAWVVHCQPVGRGLPALKYLAPYIFRVALSNQRIVKLARDKVTFRYRATDTGVLKTCTLHVAEFIRRYLQHVLPKGFVKVRYYGFLSSGLRSRLALIRGQLALFAARQPAVEEAPAETADVVTPVARPGVPVSRLRAAIAPLRQHPAPRTGSAATSRLRLTRLEWCRVTRIARGLDGACLWRAKAVLCPLKVVDAITPAGTQMARQIWRTKWL